MRTSDVQYRPISLLLTVSALLCFAAPFLSGFVSASLTLAFLGLAYLVAAFALGRAGRPMAWILFFLAFIAALYAMGGVWAASAVPAWIYSSLAVANGLLVAMLFVVLWRSPQATPV